MKTLIRISGLVLFAAIVTSCIMRRPIAIQSPDNNPTYHVHYLFEHEGCKVYRFMDYGNFIYFTNCTGETTSIVDKDSTEVRITNSIRKVQ